MSLILKSKFFIWYLYWWFANLARNF